MPTLNAFRLPRVNFGKIDGVKLELALIYSSIQGAFFEREI